MLPRPFSAPFALLSVCALILISTGLVNWLAPMASDDYTYFLKGVSWDEIRSHYLAWSGRLVADTLSSLVLGWGNHWADLVNTLALLALVWILSVLGQRLAGETSWIPHPLVLLFVFILYWVNNPRLGHTTFWIVGAANYLWTQVVLFGFVLAFVAALPRPRIPLWQGLLIALLGLAAGCTNENTAPTAGLLLAWLSVLAWRGARSSHAGQASAVTTAQATPSSQGPGMAWPALWLLCLGVGIAFLLLSPGDLIRAAHPSNREWYDAPLGWRIQYHLVRRFPDSMMKYWEVMLALLLGAACLRIPRAVARRIGLAVGLSCIATLALVFAPAFPKRTLQGGFMFMLLAVAIMGHQAVQPGALKRPRVVQAALAVCAIQWILSFALIVRAYYSTDLQDQVRVSLIQQGIAQQAERTEIPGYYFLPMLNSRDAFDTFFNAPPMQQYYGTPAEIVEYPVRGPYDAKHPPQRVP